MKTIINIIIAIALSLTYISTTSAKDNEAENLRRYDVEVIIFEDAHARYIDSEQWQKDNPGIIGDLDSEEENAEDNISLFKDVTHASEETSKEIRFESIQPDILVQQYKSLNRSSEFNVLMYSAWRQTGLSKEEAFEIDVNDLNNTHVSKSENTVSGKLKVVLARYLHFYSQLEYQRPSTLDDNKDKVTNVESTEADTNGLVTDGGQNIELAIVDITYPVQNHRRMRSKELHYIDHPMVGILIQINPAPEIAKPEDPDLEKNTPEEIKHTVQNEQANAVQFQNVDPIHR